MSRFRGSLVVDRRGVSETLGYILVFSIIITTISAASVVGFGGLEDRQAAEEVRNVERAFDVLRDNMQDLQRYEEPSRGTEIRLAGGTLGLGEPVRITVGQWDGGGFSPNNETNVTFRPLVYRGDGGTVVYESGVVFRDDGAASVARSSTPFVVGDTRAVLPVIATDPAAETTAVGGERTVLVVSERKRRGSTTPIPNSTVAGEDLRLRIESPRADGWARLLRAEGLSVTAESADVVVVALPAGVDRATMPESRIDIGFR